MSPFTGLLFNLNPIKLGLTKKWTPLCLFPPSEPENRKKKFRSETESNLMKVVTVNDRRMSKFSLRGMKTPEAFIFWKLYAPSNSPCGPKIVEFQNKF